MKFHGMCPSGLFLKVLVITQHLLPFGIESSVEVLLAQSMLLTLQTAKTKRPREHKDL